MVQISAALACFLLGAAYALGILVHVPLLRRIGRRRDYWVFSCLILMAMALSFALVLVPDRVPNPTDLINRLVMGFGREFFRAK